MTKSLRGIVLAAGACVLAVEYCPVPWSAVFVTAALPFLLLGLQAQRAAATALMINSAAVCCAFGLVEGYLGFQQLRGDGTRMEGSITEGFTRTDDVLGYGPERSVRVTARKLYGNIPLYDVVYTIGDDGLRIAYPANATPISGCIVFFGDSITFGEGVNDDQTFAYLVGQKTAGRYEIYNFGFSGYGPHQMLAALQAGLAEWKVTCQPTHFIYLGWFDHIARVAGLTSWDKHGPRFALDQSGELQRDGYFDSPHNLVGALTLPHGVEVSLESSFIWARLFGRARHERPADLTLFLAVVRESARLIRDHYPNSQFHVILWDGPEDARTPPIESALRSASIPVHRLTSAIPDFRANSTRYALSLHDLHPNPIVHERLANHIIHNILAPSHECDINCEDFPTH